MLRFQGTPYENGKASGNFFKKVIQQSMPFYENLLKNSEIKCLGDTLSLKLKETYPDYYEEIKGKADGAEVNYLAYFLMLCPELIEKIDHCTTIICKDKDEKFMFSHIENVVDVRNAMCEAGAGVIGNYSFCTTSTKVIGTFIPNDNARPHIGKKNKLEIVVEEKIEAICDLSKIRQVISRIREVHPYEEPAIDIVPLLDEENFN